MVRGWEGVEWVSKVGPQSQFWAVKLNGQVKR